MRDKILQQLKQAGHGITFPVLVKNIPAIYRVYDIENELYSMESDKLVFLHRADGSANTVKGEIVLITLRLEGH